jgi:hypothetical protein
MPIVLALLARLGRRELDALLITNYVNAGGSSEPASAPVIRSTDSGESPAPVPNRSFAGTIIDARPVAMIWVED